MPGILRVQGYRAGGRLRQGRIFARSREPGADQGSEHQRHLQHAGSRDGPRGERRGAGRNHEPRVQDALAVEQGIQSRLMPPSGRAWRSFARGVSKETNTGVPRLEEMAAKEELPIPAINVNEGGKPDPTSTNPEATSGSSVGSKSATEASTVAEEAAMLLPWCTRPSTSLPRSARAFNNVARLRQAAQLWHPDTSENVSGLMDSLTGEEFDAFLPNEEAIQSFTVWAAHQWLQIQWSTCFADLLRRHGYAAVYQTSLVS